MNDDLNAEITMEDVEIAIKVINIFMRQAELARRTMRRLGIREGRGERMPSSMEDWMRMAWSTRPQARGSVESEEPERSEPLTDEERKRLDEIKDTLKKKGKV